MDNKKHYGYCGIVGATTGCTFQVVLWSVKYLINLTRMAVGMVHYSDRFVN